jgi:ubiquinone/menaquinone biosynthesis C-methylase UbiE
LHFLKRIRSEKIGSLIGDCLGVGERVIDIGAGDCFLSHYLQQKCGVDITPVDISDYSQTALKPVIYDGKSLPFSDGCFDSALVLFVLHYVEDPLALLKEAQRVSRKRIIILQDLCPNNFVAAPTLAWGYFANLRRHSDRKLPYAVTEDKMSEFLELLSLKPIIQKNFVSSLSLYLIKHQLIVAEKA